MTYTIEVKIRLIGDLRDWEELPVIFIFDVGPSKFGEGTGFKGQILAAIRKGMNPETVKEIRWNWSDSTQGYYIN